MEGTKMRPGMVVGIHIGIQHSPHRSLLEKSQKVSFEKKHEL